MNKKNNIQAHAETTEYKATQR